MNTLTNISGIASSSINYTNDQPVVGVVRKGSASKFFKPSPISGTITVNGFSASVFLVDDE